MHVYMCTLNSLTTCCACCILALLAEALPVNMIGVEPMYYIYIHTQYLQTCSVLRKHYKIGQLQLVWQNLCFKLMKTTTNQLYKLLLCQRNMCYTLGQPTSQKMYWLLNSLSLATVTQCVHSVYVHVYCIHVLYIPLQNILHQQ